MPAAAKSPLVYLDSCIFLHVIKDEPGFGPEALRMLLAAERGDIRLVASTLVLVEVASWKGDVTTSERDKVIDKYLSNAPVDWYELDAFVAEKARALCDHHKMRGADATHLATAVRAKADYLVSTDTRFPYGEKINGVEIIKPTILWTPTLDDA